MLRAVLLTALLSSLLTYALCRKQWVPIKPMASLPNGMVYIGDIQDGMFNGHGELIGVGKEKFVGTFVNGRMEGAGEYWDPAGNYYRGNFIDGTQTGEGIAEFINGSRYQGQFEAGELKGFGELTYSSGETYEGNFENSLFHGEGKFQQNDNLLYEGWFEKGHIIRGKSNSYGNIYEGEFKDWTFHGKGTFTDSEGKSYSGIFSDGSLTGEGLIKYPDGSVYEGEILDWAEQGVGKRTEANGDIYTGEFEWGQYNGEGELKLAEPKNNISVLKGIWYWGELEEDPRDPPPFDYSNTERLLYTQNTLLNEQFNRINPSDDSSIEMYALGVGSYEKQDVFLKEIEFIQSTYEKDDFAKHRSAYLVNNYKTSQIWPLATHTSFEQTIHQIESKMDVNNDILFIYFTSHGSKSHELSIQMKGIKLPDLSSDKFSNIISKSRIKWKVIIVSACYSGGFIPGLADDNSLVISAARDDRTSFGCGDDSEMTYFGKAFFKEALPNSSSFVEAFNKAKDLVWVWEATKLKDEKHSEPQIHVGSNIERHLTKWRSQFSGVIASPEPKTLQNISPDISDSENL